jgi:hypothetical protein
MTTITTAEILLPVALLTASAPALTMLVGKKYLL